MPKENEAQILPGSKQNPWWRIAIGVWFLFHFSRMFFFSDQNFSNLNSVHSSEFAGVRAGETLFILAGMGLLYWGIVILLRGRFK
jgi:hypothetical protein